MRTWAGGSLVYIRAFVAVDVEGPELVSRIRKIQDSLLETGSELRLVKPENLHFTVKFLDRIDDGLVGEIEKALRDLELCKFSINIAGIGAFPSHRRPRVIWLGVREGEKEFISLMRMADDAISKLGFQREHREPTAHLTIARVKRIRSIEAIRKLFSALADVEIGRMVVDHIRIKKSTLTPKGPIYETLVDIELK